MPTTELDKQLAIEQLNLLYKQSFAAFAATIAVLLFVLFWVHNDVALFSLYLWVGAVVLLNIYLLLWMYFVHQGTVSATINSKRANRFILIYQIQSVLHGSTWGVIPFLLIGLTSPEMKFFAYIILCGMAAGAIGTTAMIYRVYLSFMLPMMLPVIVAQLFLYESNILFSLSTLQLLIIFVVSVLVLAHTHYESIKRSIVLMVENKQLLNKTADSFKKAEAASQAKSNFLAHMSHELRTPLNAVIGYSEIIYDNAKEKDFSSIPKDAEKITHAGKHLLALISNVLDLSKIESGKMDVYIEDINIYHLLEEVKASIEAIITGNENDFIFDVPENISIIKSDRIKLSQILINILSNAAKFTQQGEVSIKAVILNDNLNISISDTGIGMTEKQLKDISTPFTQADASTTRKYGGTGLGMALTERLAKILGIKIEIKSEADIGTHFDLIIPLVYKPV